MSRWRSAAIEHLPEFRRVIASSQSVMALWIQLREKFEDAYRPPRNNDLIRRIYGYADWCRAAPRRHDAGHDPSTAVMVAFYEHIPDFPAAREDMPRWFTADFVAECKPIFAYQIGEAAFDELLKFMTKNRHRYAPPAKPKRREAEKSRRGKTP